MRENKLDRTMGVSWNWFAIVRRKFLKSSTNRTIIVIHNDAAGATRHNEEVDSRGYRNETSGLTCANGAALPFSYREKKALSKEDIAAVKIQAIFRGHLARRAFRALKSLVKLQAVVRGVHVRRQAHLALCCMHAIVRLQVRVRARQLLSRCGGKY